MQSPGFFRSLSAFGKGLLAVLLLLSFVLMFTWKSKSSNPEGIKPKVIKTVTSTSSPLPAVAVSATPSAAPVKTLVPVPTKVPVQNTGIGDFLLSKVNQYRKSIGLYEVAANATVCSFAAKRAREISVNFNHDGFGNFPYPKYSRVTENIAMDTNYTDVVSQWINSPIHAEIMRQDTPYVCIQSVGNYYAYEGWKP
jgi:uncharacterized protein YkwD